MDWFLRPMNLFILQTISAVVLVVLILLQAKGVGLSGAFGGEGSFYRSRRGVEKIVFNLTIVFSGFFLTLSFLALYAK